MPAHFKGLACRPIRVQYIHCDLLKLRKDEFTRIIAVDTKYCGTRIWTGRDSTADAIRLCFCSASAVPRLCFGCALAVLRLCFGCASAVLPPSFGSAGWAPRNALHFITSVPNVHFKDHVHIFLSFFLSGALHFLGTQHAFIQAAAVKLFQEFLITLLETKEYFRQSDTDRKRTF